MSSRCWLRMAVIAAIVALSATRVRAADGAIDSVMYRSPELPMPELVRTFPEGLTELWLKALERPEADLQSRAARSIAKAPDGGMKGLGQMVPALVRELEQRDQHPSVRIAAARALVVLDAKDAAASFSRFLGSSDGDLREIVEPALAKWDYAPARADWLSRLEKPPYRRGTILAIRGLAAVGEQKAVPRLRELTLSPNVPATVRLEAAKALGALRRAGSEADARRLSADASPHGITDRLAAAALLRHHKGAETIRLLQTLPRDAEPAVAAAALERLIELDPGLVEPFLDTTLQSADARVRAHGTDVLIRRPSDHHLRLLADQLNDPHPGVRGQARRGLQGLAAKAEWRDTVIREGARVIRGDDWRGLEQAAILLVQLDHKPAASRLLKLLQNDRPEVAVAAAWGLRRLAVADTLAGALEYLRATVSGRRTLPAAAEDQQLSQLAQFLGQSRFAPADPVLRPLVAPSPGGRVGGETRSAAVWALGLIHEGKAVPELVGAFVARLSAVVPPDVEDGRVRRMAAISLGRMKTEDGLSMLRKFYTGGRPTLDPVHNACGWAIEQITGEVTPAAGTFEVPQRDWFLTPID